MPKYEIRIPRLDPNVKNIVEAETKNKARAAVWREVHGYFPHIGYTDVKARVYRIPTQAPMDQQKRYEIVVEVFSHRHNGPDVSEDAAPHVAWISKRYSELKSSHDFTTSAYLARLEWLTQWMEGKLDDPTPEEKGQ